MKTHQQRQQPITDSSSSASSGAIVSNLCIKSLAPGLYPQTGQDTQLVLTTVGGSLSSGVAQKGEMDMSRLPPAIMVAIVASPAPAHAKPPLVLLDERMGELHGGLGDYEGPQNRPEVISGLTEPSSIAQNPITTLKSVLVAKKSLCCSQQCR